VVLNGWFKTGDHGYLALYQRRSRTCQPSFPGQLTAKLFAVLCPSDDRMSVQASQPIHTAALWAYRTKKEPEAYSPLTLICAKCLADGIKKALSPSKAQG